MPGALTLVKLGDPTQIVGSFDAGCERQVGSELTGVLALLCLILEAILSLSD